MTGVETGAGGGESLLGGGIPRAPREEEAEGEEGGPLLQSQLVRAELSELELER